MKDQSFKQVFNKNNKNQKPDSKTGKIPPKVATFQRPVTQNKGSGGK